MSVKGVGVLLDLVRLYSGSVQCSGIASKLTIVNLLSGYCQLQRRGELQQRGDGRRKKKYFRLGDLQLSPNFKLLYNENVPDLTYY